MAIAGRDLHLHQRPARHRGAVAPWPSHLPETHATSTEALTPREIVAELDKHVVGQAKAKRAVAIALRNRLRRQKLPPELAEEVTPKNILMIGPTGVGKTEIARRLARLAQSPFIKVEASKFTEVGYVGRDVESMVRDLVELGHRHGARGARGRGARARRRRTPRSGCSTCCCRRPSAAPDDEPARREAATGSRSTRERLREQLRDGRLDERIVEIEVRDERCRRSRSSPARRRGNRHQPEGHAAGHVPGPHARSGELQVPEALEHLTQEEAAEAHRHGQRSRAPRSSASSRPASSSSTRSTRSPAARAATGPDVCREGVQRDILPIVEGTTVNTKYGMVQTDHILFIAAGAFHVSKPSDLIPELQGRFPIRVELEPLGTRRLRPHPDRAASALVKQYIGAARDRGRRRSTSRATRSTEIADFATDRQRADREHRRAPPAHRHGTAARRGLVRGARTSPTSGDDRRGLRRSHAGRHRQERRSFALHPVIGAGRLSPFPRRAAARCPCRRGGAALPPACGKKGPPLAPYSKAPSAPPEVVIRRKGDQVEIRFKVPGINSDGRGPASIDLASRRSP